MNNITPQILVAPLTGPGKDSGQNVYEDGTMCAECARIIPFNEIGYAMVSEVKMQGRRLPEMAVEMPIVCFRCAKEEQVVMKDGVKIGHQYIQMRVAFLE